MAFVRCLMIALVLICWSATPHAAAFEVPKSITLVAHVTGPDGAPVSDARVWLHQSTLWNRDDITLAPSANTPGEYRYEGPLPKNTRYPGSPCALVAQSPSGAVAYSLTTIKTLPVDFQLQLPKTRSIRVKVKPWKGAPPLPSNARLTATPEPLLAVLSGNEESTGGLVASVREDGDTFVLPVDPESTQTRVRFDAPGYLHLFVAPPLNAGEDVQTIELPEPGHLKISYSPAERFKARPPYDHATIVLFHSEESRRVDILIGCVGTIREDKKGTHVKLDFTDLAPGKYSILASTAYDDRKSTAIIGLPAGESYADATVRSGETKTVAMEYDDIDLNRFRGNMTADLTVLMPDGTPAAGQEYKIRVRDNEGRYATLTSGTVAANGGVLLKGLTSGFDGETTDNQRLVRYDFMVGQRETVPLKLYLFDKGAETFHATTETLVREIKLPPGVSDMAPDVMLQKVDGSGTFRIADFRGKVLVLDFWATWCGPCQEPMAHLNELAVKNVAAYKDKVALVGASIDDDLPTLQAHLRKNGWDKITQGWCGPEGDMQTGRQSAAAAPYGINGVPTTFIIDREGKIAWRGHPAGLPLELIDKLAAEK